MLIGVAIALVVLVGALAGAMAFGTSAPPQPMASISNPFRSVDYSDLPAPISIPSPGGSPLSVHVYEANGTGGPARTAILIHGSSAMGASMHRLAKALRDAGVTVYAPDVRGHGRTGRRGDIDYFAQLDDDLGGLVAAAHAAHPGAPISLIGFSSGGGYALHAAATPLGAQFERAVLISPMLGPQAPTVRGGFGNAWAQPYIPRIVALVILNKLGIHAFDALPTLAFGIAPENADRLTGIYSFRLMAAFGTRDYAADLTHAKCPLSVLVGGADELFAPEKFAPTVQTVRPDAPVTVIPDIDHINMILDPRSIGAVVATVRG